MLSSSSSHSQRGPSRRSSTMTASKGLSPEVGRCLAGVVSDLVDPSATWATRPATPASRRNGEDDRVRGWRETVELYVLGCCPAVWRCDQRRRCDAVGWRRWWQVDQWEQIFPSCERIASTRFSGFCVGISYGLPPGTWHLLKWEFMSRRHREGRTRQEQDKRVFWWEGVAGVPSR